MFYDDFEVGDVIRWEITHKDVRSGGYIKTGKYKYVVLTKGFLDNIKKFEDETNFHNFRIVTKVS